MPLRTPSTRGQHRIHARVCVLRTNMGARADGPHSHGNSQNFLGTFHGSEGSVRADDPHSHVRGNSQNFLGTFSW